MPKFQVIITDHVHEPLSIERSVLGDIAEVAALEATSNADLDSRVEQADALMVFHFVSIEAELMKRMKNLKVVARCGAGFDNVDGAFARQQGIAVTNVPDYGTEDVADTAIGLVLSIARGTHRMSHLCQSGAKDASGAENWSYELGAPLRRIRGQVFGILGLGRIGTAVALRAKAFGYQVVFFDPYVSDGSEKALGIQRVETLSALMQQSHVVSCHCLLSEETRQIINRDTIAMMPRGGILVNTSRGSVVDPLAVLEALESGHLMGAALDVLPQEPPDSAHPLVQAWRTPGHPAHERLLLTPHAAFYCEEGLADMRLKAAKNVRSILLGEPCRNVVN